MKHGFRILDVETGYEGFLKLNRYRLKHDLFAGGESGELVRERVESYRAASVLLFDPVLDKLVLIEQFRIGAMDHPDGAWVLEVVGGVIDEGESPEEVAFREAVEEAGCPIEELLPICDFMVAPGTSTEHIHLFCGRVDARRAAGIHGIDEEGEDIRVEVLDADRAIGELYGGRINSTSSIIAVQWLAMNRERLRRLWG